MTAKKHVKIWAGSNWRVLQREITAEKALCLIGNMAVKYLCTYFIFHSNLVQFLSKTRKFFESGLILKSPSTWHYSRQAKGQLFSECLFGVLNFPKNQLKIFALETKKGFFGRFKNIKKTFWNYLTFRLCAIYLFLPKILTIEIKNNKARRKIRIVNTARWP